MFTPDKELRNKLSGFPKEQDEYLCSTYPLLYRNRHVKRHPMYYGFTCGQGWFELIKDLSSKLEPLIQAQLDAGTPLEEAMEAAQVKQKFAGLRFYTYGQTTEEMYALISEACAKAESTCELTGQEGSLVWMPFELGRLFFGWRYRVSREAFKLLCADADIKAQVEAYGAKNPEEYKQHEELLKKHFWDIIA
jgi:hypothetical protein